MSDHTITVGFTTDVGRLRSRNEDSLALFLPYPGEPNPSRLAALLVVADGMGGEQGGEVASRLAADRLRQWFVSGEYLGWTQPLEDSPPRLLEAAMRRSFLNLGEEVNELGEQRPELRGLGSTLVAAAFADGRVTVAHVGDSRCYRVRGGRIERLTEDHSWVERQVRAGVLSAEQARQHPQRNILTRSLGDETPPEPDLWGDTIAPGDTFVLCSDGLTGSVSDDDILSAALAAPSAQALAASLVQLANERDGSDNITVVAGKVGGVEEITRPNLELLGIANPSPKRWPWILGILLALVVGVVGGALWSPRAPQPPPPGLEQRARDLLQEGERSLTREQPLAARESFTEALALFRRAPEAVEAQRRLSELARQLGGAPPAEDLLEEHDSGLAGDDASPATGGTASEGPRSRGGVR